MGVNNRKRRAAKQRKRAKARAGGRPRPESDGRSADQEWPWQGVDEQGRAADLVATAVNQAIARQSATRRTTAALLGGEHGVPIQRIIAAMQRLLTRVVSDRVQEGWTPGDLGEIVKRRHGRDKHALPMLAALVAAHAAQHPADRVHPQWRAELSDMGPQELGDLGSHGTLATAVSLAATLTVLPEVRATLPPPGASPMSGRSATGGGSRQLARVRALLAKAESTDFPDEAEALSAKAQELISRYALERLVAEGAHPGTGATATIRRLWIDAPYVRAKAMLVDVVAQANGCRSVLSEDLGFSTVLGAADDLDAVEMLATSLLVQADHAMLQHGRQVDQWGSSRTRSFRQAFLISYAHRISERLTEAADDAAAQSGHAGELVPLLQAREERAEALMGEMFPRIRQRQTSVSNGAGWAAGRAAADLAHLDRATESLEAPT